MGTRQSGLPDFKLAHLIQDEAVLLEAKKQAGKIIEVDPNLDLTEHKTLKKEFIKRQKSMPFDSFN